MFSARGHEAQRGARPVDPCGSAPGPRPTILYYMLYYNILYYILYYSILYYTILYYNILYYTIL